MGASYSGSGITTSLDQKKRGSIMGLCNSLYNLQRKGMLLMSADQTPEYRVGLRTSSRLVQGQHEPKIGTAWEVTRFIGKQEGRWQDSEVLFVSPDVFDSEDDAKRDAIQTLESLQCCDTSPMRIAFRTAIDWMVEES